MRERVHAWGLVRLMTLTGCLVLGGCLARLEGNLDFLLAPDAVENTLSLPFREVAPFMQLLVRLFV